jgi:hypothetical protein
MNKYDGLLKQVYADKDICNCKTDKCSCKISEAKKYKDDIRKKVLKDIIKNGK